jgi:hypothetical protein
MFLNVILPFYDDVIISMLNNSLKLITNENDINMRKLKKERVTAYIDNYNDNDKIIIDEETNNLTIKYGFIDDLNHIDTDSDNYSSSEDNISYCILKRIQYVVKDRFIENNKNKCI